MTVSADAESAIENSPDGPFQCATVTPAASEGAMRCNAFRSSTNRRTAMACSSTSCRASLRRWHPFQLNPDLPVEGIARAAYLEAKFGGKARAAEIYARVRAAGADVGIPFDFERIDRQPNTLEAHRLIAWAQQRGDAQA